MAKERKKLTSRQKKAKQRKRKKILIITLTTLFVIFAGIFSVLFSHLPDINSYTYREPSSTVVVSSDGVEVGNIESKKITYLQREEIPDNLINAVISVEDKRFYKHNGVDVISIGRAFFRNLKAGEIVEGGSSITQQLAKLLFFSSEQSYMRKIEEAITALRLEIKYDKDEIITMYLNEIYLGGGAFGVYEASMLYFGVEPKELSIAQCAMIAGIIQAPSAYCPLDEQGFVYATERKEKVLLCMYEQEMISEEEYNAALCEEIIISPANRGEASFDYGTCLSGYRSYMNKVFLQAKDILGEYYEKTLGYSPSEALNKAENTLLTQNLTINATINHTMQQNALEAIYDNITSDDANAGCAYISIDSKNGNILSYFGADNISYIDMVDTPRQPGSTIKPLYMLNLLESGKATTDSVVYDGRFEVGGYSPSNYGAYYGYVTMRETLVKSLNTASLRFFCMDSVNSQINFVKSLGITTITDEDYNYAFSLGGLSEGIKPLELCKAYCAIGNGGVLYNENYVVSVQLEDGTLLFAKRESEKVFSERTSAEMKSCLTSVVIRGTATAASQDYATFGKTGTTDNYRDCWFVGGTGNVVTAIWVGDVSGGYIDNLSTAWCTYTYEQAISSSLDDGAISSEYLQDYYSESVSEICIIKPDASVNGEITSDDITYITVLTSRVDNFNSNRVVELAIDTTTGKIATEKCPKNNVQTKYYRLNAAPSEYCDATHKLSFIEEVEDWFTQWW